MLSVEKICGLHHANTDMKHFKHFYRLMKLFDEAMDLDGEAALEIGVRQGGTSCAMSMISFQKKKNYVVLGCDPWGKKPYDAGEMPMGKGIVYEDSEYVKAKRNLSTFQNHILFKQESIPFLKYTLPHYNWWIQGIKYPTGTPFLNFVFIDGMHDNESVKADYAGVLPFLQPQAIVVFDNISYAPLAHKELEQKISSQERGSVFEHWEDENKWVWRRNLG